MENNQQNADRALVQFCLQLGDEFCNLWQYHLYYHGWYKTKFKTEKDIIRNQTIKVRGRISIGDNSKELDNKILHIDKKTAGYYPRKGFQEDNEFWVELMKGFVKNPQQWYESIKIAPGMDIENATVNLSLASFLQATYFTSIANLIENGELKDDIHWKMGFVFRRLEHANQIRSKSDQLFGYMRAKKQEKNRNLKNVSKRISRTFEKLREGILAYYNYRISTGPLEGTNNKIKTLQRQAYGFRDINFFKLKIYALHLSRYALVG